MRVVRSLSLLALVSLCACNPFKNLEKDVKLPSFDGGFPNPFGLQGQAGAQAQPGQALGPQPSNGSTPPGGANPPTQFGSAGNTGFAPSGASGNPGGMMPPPHIPGAKLMFQLKGVD